MIRKLLKYSLLLLLLLGLSLWVCDYVINNHSENKLFTDAQTIPPNNVGLVLGTSKYVSKGNKNLFFLNRMKAAALLFKNGKIKHIIVSGDNHVVTYDEANDMRKTLLELGIPDSCITLDYAGFRTLDSVVRCKKVFGQNKFTIISQKFHNQRALFIATKNNLECIGFNAEDVPDSYSAKTKVREYFARVKCILDIYVLKTEPKFLGDPVTINF